MNKLLLVYTVSVLSLVGFVSFANAEADNSTKSPFIDVIPDCSQYNSTSFTNEGNYTKQRLICFWEVIDRTEASASQNLTSVEQTALDLVVANRESGETEYQIDLSYLDEPFTVPPIRDPDVVPESCTRQNPSPKDLEECNLDTKMSFCERGVQSTNPIQQYEHFNVSLYIPRDDIQIDLQGGGTIVNKLKAYEECRAELVLIIKLNKTHYVGIAKEVAKGEYNPYHADFATTDFVFPAGETEATESEILFQSRRAHNTFCAIGYIQESLRMEQGCPKKVYEGTYKTDGGMTNFEKRLMESSPMVDYYKYKESDGADYYPTWIKKHTFGISGINTSNDNTQWQFKATLED